MGRAGAGAGYEGWRALRELETLRSEVEQVRPPQLLHCAPQPLQLPHRPPSCKVELVRATGGAA